MKYLFFIVAFAFPLFVCAQEKPVEAEPKETAIKRKGAITGRVTSDDGQPLEGAQVSVGMVGNTGPGGWQNVNTDEDGNFLADNLTAGSYRVNAGTTAFVMPNVMDENKFFRLGESANFSLVKGGVITGKVTNALGEPVIGAQVRATRVRDAEGRKVIENSFFGNGRRTDDRGIYRLYGLSAGKYLVQVGGKALYFYGASPSAFDDDSPTFYPGTSRDTAVEIPVSLGEEVAGINIRHRGEKGYSVSGKVIGNLAEISGMFGINVELRHYPSHTIFMSTFVMINDAARTFSFFGVADGEYELAANFSMWGEGEEKPGYAAPPRRVIVKGGNLTNIILQLMPLASVEGNVVVESTPAKEIKSECKAGRSSLPEEIVVKINRDSGGKPDEGMTLWSSQQQSAPNDKGAIKFRNLEAGTYRLNTLLPDETWYVKSALLKQPVATTPNAAKTPAHIDVGKLGLNLKPGDKLKDLTITIAEGAASLRGKISAEKNNPARWRVQVIPAEKEAADDLLRYAEYKSKADGVFTFTNLAPGKYWLIARAVPAEESDEKNPPPVAWDVTARTNLRREAEAANNLVELKSCQHVSDYELKLSSVSKK